MLRYSTDGGNNWTTAFIDSSDRLDLVDLEYLESGFAIAGARDSTYYVSKDGFKTWQKKRFPDTVGVYEVSFANDSLGAMRSSWLIEMEPPYPLQYYIAFTYDGTETWFESTPDFSDIKGNTYIDEIKWLSPQDFYVFAFNYEFRGLIIHSADSGKTYQRVGNYQDRLSDIHFLSETEWVACGHRSITNKDNPKYQIITKSYDAGKTWQRKLDTVRNGNKSLTNISFYDEKKGACNNQAAWNMYYTNDGGETWVSDTTYDLDYGQGYGLSDILSEIAFVSDGSLIGCSVLNGTVWRQDFLTSVEETEAFSEIRIYPNPIPRSRAATISLDIDHPGMYSFSVFSLDGRLLDSYQTFLHTAQNTIEYQPENLPRGNYFLIISGKGGEASLKLVVE